MACSVETKVAIDEFILDLRMSVISLNTIAASMASWQDPKGHYPFLGLAAVFSSYIFHVSTIIGDLEEKSSGRRQSHIK